MDGPIQFGEPAVSGALGGFRVVELGELEAASYCGKLFSDFGAEVVKIEPAGGEAARRSAPLVDIGGGEQQSALAAWLNTNKQSVVLPPGAAGEAMLATVLNAANLLIDASDPATAAARHAALRQAHPHLSIVSLSWFGETGPYRDFKATDSVIRALAGLVKLTGPVEGPPILLNDHQASIYTGLTAYTAALAALYSGEARRFEISVLESSIVLAEFQIALRYGPPADESRLGLNKYYPTYPLGIFPCREGWLGVTVGHLDQWAAFCDMLDIKHVQADPRFQTRFDRSKHMAELDSVIGEQLKARTAAEWFEMALKRRVPLVVVPDMGELLAQDIHRERGAFSRVRIGEASFEGPTVPLHLMRTPPARRGEAPAVDADGERWRSDPPAAGTQRTVPVSAHGKRPLEGMRIIDLSMGWAGPLSTRQLSDLGAEIVKVEACAYPDWWRPTEGDKQPPFEHSPWFIALNRNKLDCAVDMYTAEGVALIKDLVATADAVVENFSAGVMPKVGLTYEALKAVNPSLVMISMPAYAGAWSDLRAYGSTLEHGSGLPSVTGPADGPPVLNHLAYGDPMGGLSGAAAVLTALLHRKVTGEGQYIVMSQIQAMLPLAAPWIIEQSVTGKVVRMGNHHPAISPHNIFRTADDDGWIVVAADSDEAWRRLAELIGRPDLRDSADLATAEGRRAREALIETAIETWTQRRSGEAAMHSLQAAGVAAAVASTPGDLYRDPHLVARDDWQVADRRYSGPQPLFAPPFRENGQAYPLIAPAPTLGEHNRRVLSGILGLSDDAIAGLEARGVIGDRGLPRKLKSAAPAAAQVN
jgi:crotonobetainyl-CoA:carnitine CoA-transferase CaiB-like acyl-CoA transferase